MTRLMTASEAAAKSAENRKRWNTSVPMPTKPAKPRNVSTRQKSAGEKELANQLRACQIYGWQCEYRFCPGRRWRLDFAWPDRFLAVEIEGGVWTAGRHTRGKGFIEDINKYNELALLGWRLLRVTPDMVKSGHALKQILIALR